MPVLTIARSACVALLLTSGTSSLDAQRTIATTAGQGINASAPLTKSALRSQLASAVKVSYQGSGSVKARAYLFIAKDGKHARAYRSAVFDLAPGERALPSNALPPTTWLPDGASSGAAFGWGPIQWIADWWNGTSTTEQDDVGDTPPANATESAAEKKEREAMNAIFPKMQGTVNTTSGTTLGMFVMPVGGPPGSTGGSIAVSGVTLRLGSTR